MPQLIQKHFYHFAHFIAPGAKRIAFSKYTHKLEVTAFQNPNGELVVVLLNRTEDAIPLFLRLKEQIVTLELPPQSIATGVVQGI